MAQQQIIDHEAFVIHPSVARDRARVFTVMSPTRVQHILDHLPPDWTACGVKRKHGQTAGRCDLYLYTPDGQKLRSSKEVERFIQSQKQVPVEDKEQEYSTLENDCQKLKDTPVDTPVTSVFPQRQKRYSSSHPSKTLRKKVKFHEKPSVSLPSENPTKRRRGRPRKLSLTQVPVEDKEQEDSPLTNDCCQKQDTPVSVGSVSLPSENPNKRKRGRPRKLPLNGEAEVCSVAETNSACDVSS